MATYSAYRHIELDKIGYTKKRVHKPPNDLFNVLCSTPSNKLHGEASRRSNSHNNSFDRLFGSPEYTPPRKSSLTKTDVTMRNPVTGNGVTSWDYKIGNRTSPRIHNERNPVTGEYYTVISPATTPTKLVSNGIIQQICNTTPLPSGDKEVTTTRMANNGQIYN